MRFARKLRKVPGGTLPSRKKEGNGDFRASSNYWDISLSRWEWFLLLLVFAFTVAMHLNPVLQSGLAKPLLFALACLCFLSPVTGFFFIGASAILPTADPAVYTAVREAFEAGDPTMSGQVDSAAKFGFLAWAVVAPIRYHRISLRGIQTLWPLAPLLLWQLFTCGVANVFNIEWLKNVFYCVMACQLANEAGGRYLKCLLGLCLGCLVIIIGYWAQAVGLPVTLSGWGGERGGFERVGSVVADSVMLWPPLITGIAGLLGMVVGLGSKLNPRPTPRWLLRLTTILFLASLPPLAAAMTHSVYVGFSIILVVIVLVLMLGGDNVRSRAFGSIVSAFLVVAIAASVLILTNSFQIRTKAVALFLNYQGVSKEAGVAASRDDVWLASIDTIYRYPLFGVQFSGGKETIPASYAAKGFYLSHNIFLDFGRSGGIPGMLLLAMFFFWPAFLANRHGRWFSFMPFLMAHLGFLIFFMSLSFYTYKAFWGFWMLMALATSRAQLTPKRWSRPRVAKKVNSPLQPVKRSLDSGLQFVFLAFQWFLPQNRQSNR